jgi:fructokinase
MKKEFKVVGIGEVLWDMPPQGKVLGGAPANFAYHASKLGAEGYIISAIGKDDLGREIMDSLSGTGMNLHISKVDYPTSTVIVHLTDKGVPTFEICQDVAWDYMKLTDEDLNLAKQTDAVCFGSLAQRNDTSRKAILKFLSNVSDKALKVFDVNLRQNYYSREILDKSIELSNILKINEDEIKILAKIYGWKGDEKSICEQIVGLPTINMLAYTCGAEGSYLYTKKESSFLKSPKVKVIDTVGAGDAFTAGLVMGLLNRKSLAESHYLAVEISANVCKYSGAMPPYDAAANELVSKLQ